MLHNSRWSFTPINASMPSFIFENPEARLFDEEDKIFIDAQRPGTHFWTLATYRHWSKRLAAGLVQRGFRPGERLALVSGNSIYTPIVFMGTIMTGGIYSSINPGFSVREIAYQMKDSEPSFILVASNCLTKAMEAADVLGFDKNRILAFEDLELVDEKPLQRDGDHQHWQTLLASPKEGEDFVWENFHSRDDADRTALLAYSSGTTGLPKGVEISHFQLVNNTRQIKQLLCSDTSIKNRRGLCALPFYHGLGLLYYGLSAPALGIQVYLMDRYKVEDAMRHIAHYRITEVLLVPPMVVAIAKHPAALNGEYDLSSLLKVVAGAAPLGEEITQQFERLWSGKLRVQQAWGMSEAPALSLAWDERDKGTSTSTSVGELLPGLEARLLADDGTDVVEPGCPGELWVRGPNILKGYWRNSKATAETKTDDGWLKTGDVASVDSAGKWYIVDRKKELIKVRGAQVAPAELEALLLEHPQIVDAAVIGMKTPDGDEEPRAYVVCRNKKMLSADSVAEFVRKRAAKQKHLCGGVVFVDELPRTAAGKILRRYLRDEAAKEAARQGTALAKL